MRIERFTRARKVSIDSNSTHTLEYVIPINVELTVNELFLSATINTITELQLSLDGGTTWINPWDDASEHLLWLMLGAGIPAAGSPQNTFFTGDGENTLLRITIRNVSASTGTAFYLIKGFEKHPDE